MPGNKLALARAAASVALWFAVSEPALASGRDDINRLINAISEIELAITDKHVCRNDRCNLFVAKACG